MRQILNASLAFLSLLRASQRTNYLLRSYVDFEFDLGNVCLYSIVDSSRCFQSIMVDVALASFGVVEY